MSTVTATQFVYSIVNEYGDYANAISNALLLTEVKEQELKNVKIATICVEAIRHYFSRYSSDVAPTDDDNGLTKEEIEKIKIFPMCSYVALDKNAFEKRIKSLESLKIKGKFFRIFER